MRTLCLLILMTVPGFSQNSSVSKLQRYDNQIIKPSGSLFSPYHINNMPIGFSYITNKFPRILEQKSERAALQYKLGRVFYISGIVVRLASFYYWFQTGPARAITVESDGVEYKLRQYNFNDTGLRVLIVGAFSGFVMSFYGKKKMEGSVIIYNNQVAKNFGIKYMQAF